MKIITRAQNQCLTYQNASITKSINLMPQWFNNHSQKNQPKPRINASVAQSVNQ